jgi:hypothetical protein
MGLEPTNLLTASDISGYGDVRQGPLQALYQDVLFTAVQLGPGESVPVAYIPAYILGTGTASNGTQ